MYTIINRKNMTSGSGERMRGCDDRLTVCATMQGLKTYTSTMNQSITIPQATADYIVLR